MIQQLSKNSRFGVHIRFFIAASVFFILLYIVCSTFFAKYDREVASNLIYLSRNIERQLHQKFVYHRQLIQSLNHEKSSFEELQFVLNLHPEITSLKFRTDQNPLENSDKNKNQQFWYSAPLLSHLGSYQAQLHIPVQDHGKYVGVWEATYSFQKILNKILELSEVRNLAVSFRGEKDEVLSEYVTPFEFAQIKTHTVAVNMEGLFFFIETKRGYRSFVTADIVVVFTLVFSIVLLALFYLIYQFNQLNDHIRHEEELMFSVEQANEANSAKSILLKKITKELKSPVNSILGFSKRLMIRSHKRWQDNEIELLQTILNNCEFLLSFINDTLDFHNIRNGQLNLNFTRVNLVNLMSNAFFQSKKNAENKGLKIILSTDFDHVFMDADPIRLVQVFENILDNSIRFSDSGIIFFRLQKRDGNKACVSIEDEGNGIPEEQLATIHESFSRNDAYQFEKENGIGLMVCHHLVKLHHGELIIESIRGKGTSVRILLPLVSTEVSEKKLEKRSS